MRSADPFSSRFEVFGRESTPHLDQINQAAFERLKRYLDLGEGGDGRVILLRAPRAGFGKTSLLQRLANAFADTHHFVRINLAGGRSTDAAHVLEYVLQALCRALPESSTLTELDLLARRILALGLEPLVASGEVPCQDRDGALLALREQPTETFDFHYDRAVTAHWTKANFEILGPRLAAELAQLSGASLREASYWVELLFRFATTAPDNVERVRLLFETIFRSGLQNQSESAAEERLHGILALLGIVTRLVLIVDDTEGLSTHPPDALALAAFLTNISQCCPGTLVLLSVNNDVWETAFVPLLPGGLADRLTEYSVNLRPLKYDEARELIRSRAGERADEILERIRWPEGELFSRQVLKAASEAWEVLQDTQPTAVEDRLQAPAGPLAFLRPAATEPASLAEDLEDDWEEEEEEIAALDAASSVPGTSFEQFVEPAGASSAPTASLAIVRPPETLESALEEIADAQTGFAEFEEEQEHEHEEETEQKTIIPLAAATTVEEFLPDAAASHHAATEALELAGSPSPFAPGSRPASFFGDPDPGKEQADDAAAEAPAQAVAEEPSFPPFSEVGGVDSVPLAEASREPAYNPFVALAPPPSALVPEQGDGFVSEDPAEEDENDDPFIANVGAVPDPSPALPTPDSDAETISGVEPTSPFAVPPALPQPVAEEKFADNPFAAKDQTPNPFAPKPVEANVEGGEGTAFAPPVPSNPFFAKPSPFAAVSGPDSGPSLASQESGNEGQKPPALAAPAEGNTSPFVAAGKPTPADMDEPTDPSPVSDIKSFNGNPFTAITPDAPAAPAGNANPFKAASDPASFGSVGWTAPANPSVPATPPPLTPASSPPPLAHSPEDLAAKLGASLGIPPTSGPAVPPPATGGIFKPIIPPEERRDPVSPFAALGGTSGGKDAREVSSIFAPIQPAENEVPDTLDTEDLKPFLEEVSQVPTHAPRMEERPAPIDSIFKVAPAEPNPFVAATPVAASLASAPPDNPPPLPAPLAAPLGVSPFKPVAATSGDSPFAAGRPVPGHEEYNTPSTPSAFGGSAPAAPALEAESAADAAATSPDAKVPEGDSTPFAKGKASADPGASPSSSQLIDSPFKPVAPPVDTPSPFAPGGSSGFPGTPLAQRTEIPPRKVDLKPAPPCSAVPSPFEPGAPPSALSNPVPALTAAPASPLAGAFEPIFKSAPDDSSPFATIGAKPASPPSAANLSSDPNPLRERETKGCAEQDKVDELLRQFKERYGKK